MTGPLPRTLAVAALLLAGAHALAAGETAAGGCPPGAVPPNLSETGLFEPESVQIAADRLLFTPQYPLWSDGATKRRWVALPPGAPVDAADPDAWEFPAGTRLWKEFSHGRPIETRYIERLEDGAWCFAAYVWTPDGRDAVLAPAGGLADLDAPGSPGGRYSIPSVEDCRACHEAAPVPVLGFSALQLSPDRDPLAPHGERAEPGADLRGLVEQGLLVNLPAALLENPPVVAARTPVERAALGYLHGNCGHCHNERGPLALLDLSLTQAAAPAAAARPLATLVGYPAEFRLQGATERVTPGDPERSVLLARMRARDPLAQMPPLGTRFPDPEAAAVVERWIREQTNVTEEKPR